MNAARNAEIRTRIKQNNYKKQIAVKNHINVVVRVHVFIKILKSGSTLLKVTERNVQ